MILDVMLTTGVDVIEGTDGDDTIEGIVSGLTSTKTLNDADVIDGGAGTDTLDLDVTSNFNGFGADGSMTNVEILDVANTSSLSRTFDATGITGLETVKVDMNDQDFTVKDLAAADMAVEVNGADGNNELEIAYATDVTDGTSDALTATLTDVGTAKTSSVAQKTFSLTSAGIEDLTVVSAGTANYADLSGVDAATSLTITGAGDLKVDAVGTKVAAVDGSAATGDLTLDLTQTTARSGAEFTSIKTGSGDDKVTVEVLKVDAVLSGGEGTDELVLADLAGDTLQPGMTGFETLTLETQSGALNFSGVNISDLTTIQVVDGLGAAATFSGLSANNMAIVMHEDDGSVNAGGATLTYSDVADLDITAQTDNSAATAGTWDDVTAAKATTVDLNVTEYVTFDGDITAAKASELTIDIDKNAELDGSTITVADATNVTITNDGTWGVTGNDIIAEDLESLTVKGSAAVNLTTAAGENLGSKSSSITVDANTMTAAFTASFDSYTSGSGSITVVGADLAANNITIEGGRNEIDITGGVDNDIVTLEEAITGESSVSIDLGTVSSLDSLMIGDGDLAPATFDFTGTGSLTLAGVDSIDSTGDTDILTLKASQISGQTIDLGSTNGLGVVTLEGTASADTIDLGDITTGGGLGGGVTSININASGGKDTITATAAGQAADIFTYTDSDYLGDTIKNFTTTSDVINLDLNVQKGTNGGSGKASGAVTGFFDNAWIAATSAAASQKTATGGTLNLLGASSAKAIVVASTLTLKLTAGTAATASITNSMVLDNNGAGFANLTALKAAIAQNGVAVASVTYAAFGLLTGGTLYQFTIKNGSDINITVNEITATNTVVTLNGVTDYTAGDIVLV